VELDLALLQVSGQKECPTLKIGTEDGLTELAEVIAFGYPFGTGLAVGKKEKPAISVNVGSITSLRLKAGELHRMTFKRGAASSFTITAAGFPQPTFSYAGLSHALHRGRPILDRRLQSRFDVRRRHEPGRRPTYPSALLVGLAV
jgi:hypothetical protein